MKFLWQLSAIRNPFLNAVFRFFSSFGEETVLIVVLCFIYWCYNKNLAYKIGLSYFISALTVNILKITFRVPRPWVLDPDFTPLDGATETATSYSFPSGHTQTASSIYLPIAISTKSTWIKAAMCLLTMGVAFARMYLGVHTPADVITALIIGLIISQFVCFFTSKQNKTNNLILIVISIAMAVGASIYALILNKGGILPIDYAEDIIKVAGSACAFAIGFYVETKYINFDETYGSVIMHTVKLVLGIAVVVILKIGLKPILGTSLLACFGRYFIMIIWVMIIYPAIIKKYIRKKESK